MLQRLFVVEGVAVNCAHTEQAVARIVHDSGNGDSFGVFTLNLDHVVKLRRDAKFRAAYETPRYVTADGFPIVLAGRLSGALVDRVTGADIIEPLCREAAAQNKSVFLFGSAPEVLERASEALKRAAPGLEVAGIAAPEQGFDPKSAEAMAFCREIEKSGASLCFVALGAPKQELFTATAIGQSKAIGFICIGAGLDFLAQSQVRAPVIFRKTGLEWAWRLLTNPRRLAKRYLECALVLPSVLMSAARRERPEEQAGKVSE